MEYNRRWEEMRYFLIEFRYAHYCQGYEWARGQVLVEADDFENACQLIQCKDDYMNAQDFVNKTITANGEW